MTKKMIVNDADRILRSLEDGFLRADQDGYITMANESIATMCGYSSPEELIGLHMKKLYAEPEERDHLIKELKEKGKLINYELKMQRKDGSHFWSLNNIKTFCDEKGNLLGTEGVIRDITELFKKKKELRAANQQLTTNEQQLRAANQQLKASEQQLEASEKKIRSIFDKSPFPVAVVGVNDEEIFYWSNSAIEMFGHNPKTTKEWYELAYPDPEYRKEVLERWKPILKKAQKFGKVLNTGEYNITCKDGSVKICELYAQFMPDNLIVTLNDITQRKQAEEARRKSDERFRIAQDMSPDGFTILHPIRDKKGRVVDFSWVYENEAVAKMNGTDPKKVVGKRLLDLFPGHRDTQIMKAYKNVAEAGKPLTFEENYSGETIKQLKWFRLVVVPMAENIAILTQDITERKQAEERLLAANQQLAATEQQLRASNQQLRAANQQLAASEQQLRANETELKRLLKKSEKQRKANLILLKDKTRNAHNLMIEIEQRKKTEKKLKESKEKYSVLAENAKHIIITHDLAGNITYANQYALDFMDLTKDQIIGENVSEFINTKKDTIAMKQRQQDFLRGKDGVHNYEIEIKTSSGESRILEAYGNPISKNNKIDSVLIVAYDITEKKKAVEQLKVSEAKLRSYIDNAPDGVFITDETGKYIEVNQAACDITGYSEKELLNMHIPDVLQKSDTEKGIQHFKKVQEKGSARGELGFVTKNGENRFWQVAATKLSDKRFLGFVKDVTEKRKAEKKLKESERKLLEAQKIAHVGSWEYIIDTDTVTWSKELYNIFERSCDLPAPKYSEQQSFYTKESFAKLDKAVKECTKNGTPYEIELDIITASGAIKHIISQGKVKKDLNNKIIGAVGTALDITKRKQTEEKIRENEERYRRLFETAQDGMLILDATTGIILDANPFVKDILEYQIEELVGKQLWEIGTFRDVVENKEKLRALQNHGYVRYENLPLKSSSGEEVHVEFVSNTYQAGDKQVIQCNIRDITKRKKAEEALQESEEKYRSIFENSALGIFRSTPEGRYEEVNKAFADILGFDSPKTMIYKVQDISKLYKYPEDREKIKKEFADKGFVKNYEIVANHPKKEKVWISINAKQHKHQDGHIYYEGTIQDITERKQAEEELRASEERFQKMLSVVPDMISIQDPQMNILYSNWQGFAEVPKNRQNTNTKCYNTYRNFDSMCPDCQAKSVMESRKPIHKTLQLPDGKWFDVRVIPILDKNSNVEMFMEWVRDITKRKQAEADLLEHQALITAIYRNAPLVLMVVDSERRIQQVNGFATQFAGRDVEEMLGLRGGEALRCFHALDDPRGCGFGEFCQECVIRNMVLDTLENSETHLQVQAPYYFQKNENEILNITFMMSTTPIIVNDKHMALVTLQDITESKKSEQKIIESQNRLKEAEEIGKLGHVEWVVAEQRSYWSDEVFRIYELDPKKGEPSYEEIMNLHTPEAAKSLEGAVLEALQNGTDYDLDIEAVMPSGKKKILHIIGKPQKDENGNVINIAGIVQDITNRKQAEEALKQSEQKYRTLISTTSEGFWMIDNKSNTIDVNKALCKMLEYEEKQMIGRSIFEFVEGENIEIFRKQVKDSETKKQRYYEIVLSSKSGKKIPAIFNTTSQFDENGKRVGSFAFITDITKRKKAEKLIEKSLREKETLLRELYHRTKNNMQVISSMLSLQTRSTENEMLKTAYKDINSKIKSMALVHKKLYESKDLSNLDLKEYITELVELIQRSQENIKNEVDIIFDMKEVIANIDLVAPLGLVVNELVSNAFKYAFPDSRTGKLEIKLYYDRNKKINLKIHDNGVAIDPKIDLRKTKSMGLQIMFQLIEYQLQGKIDYKVDNGLKWHIILDNEKFKARV